MRPVTVAEATPGDRVWDGPGATTSALFVSACPHPLYQDLMLVVWRLPYDAARSHSLDALSRHQMIGNLADEEMALPAVVLMDLRRRRLQAALGSDPLHDWETIVPRLKAENPQEAAAAADAWVRANRDATLAFQDILPAGTELVMELSDPAQRGRPGGMTGG